SIPMPHSRWNFVRSADWRPLDAAGKLEYAGPTTLNGSDGFHYKGRWSEEEGGSLMDQWWIGFFGFRSAGLGEVPKTPVSVDPGQVEMVQVDKYLNNGPGFIEYEITRHEEKGRKHEQSLGAVAELEFKRSMRALVKGGIPGIGEAEVESTTEFRARVEAQAHEAWSASDTLADTVAASYEVYPYHQLTVGVKRGNPTVRQIIPVSNELECTVHIYIYNALSETFASLADLRQMWRGLQAGSPTFSTWFAQRPVDVSAWKFPNASFELSVTGDRVRYTDTAYDHVPIPGKEELAARYVQAKLDAISGGAGHDTQD
ncbi:MAG: hypothetical protein OXQ29_27830, partial [Rhodospirillaceae bacterium]|nr:hypothetical protein [Rhodospirillaceae bacterium]